MKKKYILSIIVFILITYKIIGDFFGNLSGTQIDKSKVKSNEFIEIQNNDIVQQTFVSNNNTLASINFMLGDILGDQNNSLIVNILDSENNIRFNRELNLEEINKYEYNKLEINPIIDNANTQKYILKLELKNKETDTVVKVQRTKIDSYKLGELTVNNEPVIEYSMNFFLETRDSSIEQIYSSIEKLNNSKFFVVVLVMFGISFFSVIKLIITIDK